ncbi:C-X-C motif chemokine 13 isoform X2 [Hyperolius riggenbachi]|uniref:C-X-C motif chemokine 13 isoform X2 n=1 Tax=Hyperolius riggenbachi TaxID=752182 RepID=UPI0035A3AD27
MGCIYELLFISLLFHSLSVTCGMPWESRFILGKCKCLKQTSTFIHPASFQRVQILQERHNCRKKEIIIFLKDNKVVCVDPEAAWVEILILKKKKSSRNVYAFSWPLS